MTAQKMRKILEERLADESRKFSYDREKSELRVENIHTKKGVKVSLPPIIANWEKNNDSAIDEVVYFVSEGLNATSVTVNLTGNEKDIFPVIRSTSFPKKTKEDVSMITDEHTAETRIYYAVDMGNTFRLIDENMLKNDGWDHDRLKETARFNVRSLPSPLKKETLHKMIFIS